MAEDEVTIKIKGEIEGLRQSINEAKTTIQNFSSEAKESLTSGFNIKDMITGLIGFDIIKSSFSAITGFIKGSINAFADQEVANKRLEAAFRATGMGTEASAKELIDYASTLQQITRFSDDSIIKMMSFLATFKMSGSEIKNVTPIVLDMAEALDMDLKSAAMLVGKAFAGEYGTLSRYGIIIDENRVKTEGFAYVIEELSKKFGGFATEIGDTTAGKITKLSNAWVDFKEAFGGKVATPVLTPILTWLTNLLTGPKKGAEITEWIDSFSGAVISLDPELKQVTEDTKGWADVQASVDLKPVINQIEDENTALDKNINRWKQQEDYIKSHPEQFGYTPEASKPKSNIEEVFYSKDIEDYYRKATMSDKDYAIWKEGQRRDELLKEAVTADQKRKIWEGYYSNVEKIEEQYSEKKQAKTFGWSKAELIGPEFNYGLEELKGLYTYNIVKKIEVEVKNSGVKVDAKDTNAAVKIGKAVLTMAGG